MPQLSRCLKLMRSLPRLVPRSGKVLDVKALYGAVRERGGCDAVTTARAWPEVAGAVGLWEAAPDVAATLRSGGAASSAAALKCAPD